MEPPKIPGLPEPPKVKITDDLEVAAFTFGAALAVIYFLVTGDAAGAVFLAPALSTILWAPVRAANAIAGRRAVSYQLEEDKLRDGLVNRVSWEIEQLESARSEGVVLDLEASQRLRGLKAIETRNLWDIDLMQRVLGDDIGFELIERRQRALRPGTGELEDSVEE